MLALSNSLDVMRRATYKPRRAQYFGNSDGILKVKPGEDEQVPFERTVVGVHYWRQFELRDENMERLRVALLSPSENNEVPAEAFYALLRSGDPMPSA